MNAVNADAIPEMGGADSPEGSTVLIGLVLVKHVMSHSSQKSTVVAVVVVELL